LLFETTYDSVRFFNRSLFKGRWSLSRTFAANVIRAELLFQIRAFLLCDAAFTLLCKNKRKAELI
jgi:hypothetical protein